MAVDNIKQLKIGPKKQICMYFGMFWYLIMSYFKVKFAKMRGCLEL